MSPTKKDELAHLKRQMPRLESIQSHLQELANLLEDRSITYTDPRWQRASFLFFFYSIAFLQHEFKFLESRQTDVSPEQKSLLERMEVIRDQVIADNTRIVNAIQSITDAEDLSPES